MTSSFGPELLSRLGSEVVGRRRELEVAVAALAAGRHLLLEGPPGTGKSTVLRAVANAVGQEFVFVEGNAELTPARLVGAFDPSAVLSDGYSPENFVDGPLLTALREGALLYVEEINRIPEETLNVLIGVMSEGEVHVPRLGAVEAADGFRLVAAAVYDRCCRLVMGYQSADDEALVVGRESGAAAAAMGPGAVLAVVAMVRDSRQHPDVRTGSSVRGAIDLVLVAHELAALRSTEVLDPGVTLDAALLALSGRIRMREGAKRTPEDVVTELWQRHLGPVEDTGDRGEADDEGGQGKA